MKNAFNIFIAFVKSFRMTDKLPKNKKNPLYELNSKEFIQSKNRDIVKLDYIDKKIIRELIIDPRIKFTDLSEKHKLLLSSFILPVMYED